MTNDQILAELGFAESDEATKEQIIENVRTIVELRVVTIVTDTMTDEQLDQFNTLKAAGDDAAVWDWLKTSVVGVDVSEIYEEILAKYIEEKKDKAFKP